MNIGNGSYVVFSYEWGTGSGPVAYGVELYRFFDEKLTQSRQFTTNGKDTTNPIWQLSDFLRRSGIGEIYSPKDNDFQELFGVKQNENGDSLYKKRGKLNQVTIDHLIREAINVRKLEN